MRVNIKSSLIWLVLLMLLLGRCLPASAAAFDARLIGPEVEIIDENGQPVANNTYFVECDAGQVLTISIEVQFVDGAVVLLTGEYCGAKIYVVGWVQLARIVAVSSAPDAVSYRLYLPSIAR